MNQMWSAISIINMKDIHTLVCISAISRLRGKAKLIAIRIGRNQSSNEPGKMLGRNPANNERKIKQLQDKSNLCHPTTLRKEKVLHLQVGMSSN